MKVVTLRRTTALLSLAVCMVVFCAWAAQEEKDKTGPSQPASPADGHTIHVTAPHVVDGKVMDPYHHYCKVLSPEPVIECLCYTSSDPGARLEQVEYIVEHRCEVHYAERCCFSGRLEQELARPQTGDCHWEGTGA